MRVRRLAVFALSAALLLAFPAASEDRGQRFLELMGHMPAEIWANRSPLVPEFLDYEAASHIVEQLGAAHPGKVKPDAQRIVSGPFPSDTPIDADWDRTVGFGRDDILATALARDGVDSRMALLLTPDGMAGVAPALLATGYTQSDDRGFPAFWRTAEDNGIDMTLRNRDDPFAASLPKSSRIALKGDVLLYASNWPKLDSMATAEGSNPVLKAFALALNMPDWGSGQVVQALIFSDPMAFSPGFRLAEGLTPVATPAGEVPYWSNMMVADLSDGASDLTLLVLLYTSRSDAESAARALETGLPDVAPPSFGNKTLGEVAGVGSAMVAGDGPFLAIYALQSEPDIRSSAFPSNRGYRVLSQASFMREIYMLGPTVP